MSTIIREDELRTFVNEGVIIQNGSVDCAEGHKYDFRLGNRFLKAGFNSVQTYDELKKRDAAIVEPGEVVFVLTCERVEIPIDVSVTLFDKRKMSHEGISLLGGSSIDPGYRGYLVFGIHNIAGKVFHLKPGRKLIGATFYRLSTDEIVPTPCKFPEPLETFPDDLETLIEQYKPVNPAVINAKLVELQTRLDADKVNLTKQITDLDTKIESSIGTRIASLSSKLSEVDQRTRDIDKAVLSISTWAKVIAAILGIAGAIAAGILTGLFEKIFNLG